MLLGIDATHCLCSMHVHSGARLIAIKSLMLSVFKFCFLLFQLLYLDNKDKNRHGVVAQAWNHLMHPYEQEHVATIELVICVVLALVSMLLFYGNRQHKSEFYYPFIIYSALEAIQAIVNISMFTYLTFDFARGGQSSVIRELPKEKENQFLTACIIITAVITFLYAIRTYLFLIVIIQAQRFLIRAKLNPNSSRLTVPTNLSNVPESKMLSDFPVHA